jgi:aminomethyltransferase
VREFESRQGHTINLAKRSCKVFIWRLSAFPFDFGYNQIVTTTLLEINRQLGAHFFEPDSHLVRDYGDVPAEVQAITSESGVIDMAHLGVIRVDGRSQLPVLDRLLKTDLATFSLGLGLLASICDADGTFDQVIVLAKENEFWLYASAHVLEKLGAQISSVDSNDSFVVLSVQGAFASDTLGRSIGKAIALDEYHWGAMRFFDGELTIVKHARTGVDGFDVLVPREHAAILWEILTSNHARPAGLDALNTSRREAGLPADKVESHPWVVKE